MYVDANMYANNAITVTDIAQKALDEMVLWCEEKK